MQGRMPCLIHWRLFTRINLRGQPGPRLDGKSMKMMDTAEEMGLELSQKTTEWALLDKESVLFGLAPGHLLRNRGSCMP